MPRNDPKVMWSARLPPTLVGQISDAADDEGVSQADLAERIFGEWLDDRARPRATSWARGAPEALPELVGRLSAAACSDSCYVERLVLCVKCNAQAGVVVGLTEDPVALLSTLTEFATIVAGAAGRQLRVVQDDE
jgi:hypothetical protein